MFRSGVRITSAPNGSRKTLAVEPKAFYDVLARCSVALMTDI
jgi:hypothetical protein